MFGLFNKFKKKQVEAFDYNFVSVDLHSHVLPGIDDGAQTVEDSAILVTEMQKAGIKKIIATPHIMIDYYRNTPDSINRALDILRAHLERENINIPIEAAAEHYYDENFLKLIDTDQLMLIEGKYVLFELAFTSKPPNVIHTIQKITDKGYTPILAHPERYLYLNMQELERFRSWGCLIQLNTISLTGYYGKPVKSNAEALVDAGIIDFISSDMHHIRHAEAFKAALQTPYLEKLKNQEKLLNKQLL